MIWLTRSIPSMNFWCYQPYSFLTEGRNVGQSGLDKQQSFRNRMEQLTRAPLHWAQNCDLLRWIARWWRAHSRRSPRCHLRRSATPPLMPPPFNKSFVFLSFYPISKLLLPLIKLAPIRISVWSCNLKQHLLFQTKLTTRTITRSVSIK